MRTLSNNYNDVHIEVTDRYVTTSKPLIVKDTFNYWLPVVPCAQVDRLIVTRHPVECISCTFILTVGTNTEWEVLCGVYLFD